ncbi:MAG: sulfatase [Spirochaetes bacterium]|nr:sulfatase [Spirochaetota bacterium]
MNFERIKKILNKPASALGGVILFILLFVYGLVKNLSMEYMGNTSRQAEQYILDNFLGYILLYLLKIFAAYIIIGIITGLAALFITESFLKLIKKSINFRKRLIINFFASGIIFIIFFFKDITLYPQVYINNFYVRNPFNGFIVDLLSDNTTPFYFTVMQICLLAIIAFFIIVYLKRISGRVKIFITNRKVIYCLSALVLIIIAYSFIDFQNTDKLNIGKPNILILASDALRPDHFSGYGYFRKTTPNIDRLIGEGVSFKNTFIEVPRTFPSWVSLLTGQFASTHGIRHMFPASRDLNRNFKTIVKELNGHGYSTAVIGDYAADIFSRIDLGFGKVDAPYFNFNMLLEQVILDAHFGLLPFITGKAGLVIFPVLKDSAYFCPPELIKDKVIDAVKKSKKPFFITTFFSSTHFPYSSPYPYYRLYSKKGYNGPYKYFKQRIISLEETGESAVSPEDIEQINALYDGGLKAFDDAAGEVLDYLSESGIMENTIIVLLSDHGENLYEASLGMGHGEHFRGRNAVRIPFIIRHPGLNAAKNTITETVRAVDAAPTILDMLNYPVPDFMEGVSLLPLIKGKKNKLNNLHAFGETGIWFDNSDDSLFFQKLRIMYPDITLLSEVDMHFDKQIVLKDDYRDIINLAKHRYVFDGRYKLIYMPLRDKVIYELYDTLRDPEEKKNIAASDKKNFSRLRKTLLDWIGRNGDVIIKKDYVFPVLRY